MRSNTMPHEGVVSFFWLLSLKGYHSSTFSSGSKTARVVPQDIDFVLLKAKEGVIDNGCKSFPRR